MCKFSKDLMDIEDTTDLDDNSIYDVDNSPSYTFTLFDITLNIYL